MAVSCSIAQCFAALEQVVKDYLDTGWRAQVLDPASLVHLPDVAQLVLIPAHLASAWLDGGES